MANLAIIPARGGSKRIPRKNIRLFRGKPIIAWSIEAAIESRLFDEIMVSTDDDEIAEIAIANGAAVPFRRSTAASNDFATTADVILEVIESYRTRGRHFDHGCCLYPTAPFVTPADLAAGFEELRGQAWDVVLPVASFSYPIWRSLKRTEQGQIAMNFPEHLNTRSQDLPTAYHDAGQWCWFRAAAITHRDALLGDSTGSLVLDAARVQDIDTEEDWRIAEQKHQSIFG